MLSVGIVDYGVGNIASVMKAVDYAGGDPVIVSSTDDLRNCDKLILPGVGAAGRAVARLREKNLDEALDEAVRKRGVPLMGICVGLQILSEDLYEFGHHKGLGWVPGKVISLRERGITHRPVPHMGWNDVSFDDGLSDLSARLGRHKAFYFAHSFTVLADQPEQVSVTAEYELPLVAGVAFETVRAFQFHPEKSQVAGDILFQWFLEWKP